MSHPVVIKKSAKQDRKEKVLLGLVDCFIQTGKPVGSNTLKEAEFSDLSSATIRNYFSQLEQEGFLIQAHSSGGRIPTHLAYRTYARHAKIHNNTFLEDHLFRGLKNFNSREIPLLLQEAADLLAQETQCAVFLSAPRFDQDFVIQIKLFPLDSRCVCVLVTDFGVIQTEVLSVGIKLSEFTIKRIEAYFYWRLTGLKKPDRISEEEEEAAKNLYNELMVRYLVSHSNFINEDVYRTGFSRLLHYPDFQEMSALTGGLNLFENIEAMRSILRNCRENQELKFWIGEDLLSFGTSFNGTVLAIPYAINNKCVGSIALLGPCRMNYKRLFKILSLFREQISETLTRNIYKFKITFRQPKEDYQQITQSHLILLEDKRQTE